MAELKDRVAQVNKLYGNIMSLDWRLGVEETRIKVAEQYGEMVSLIKDQQSRIQELELSLKSIENYEAMGCETVAETVRSFNKLAAKALESIKGV